jgi:hypothetical protein
MRFREFFRPRRFFQSELMLCSRRVQAFDGSIIRAELQTKMEFFDDIICASRCVIGRTAKAFLFAS